jgi:membrane-bound lytic murein transglycosylase D
MPSAALLARVSAGELDTTAAAIAADVLDGTTEETKAPVGQARPRTYQVRAGDTLSAIARRTGTTIAQLKNWNKLRTTNLRIGTRLLVQSPRSVDAQ